MGFLRTIFGRTEQAPEPVPIVCDADLVLQAKEQARAKLVQAKKEFDEVYRACSTRVHASVQAPFQVYGLNGLQTIIGEKASDPELARLTPLLAEKTKTFYDAQEEDARLTVPGYGGRA